MKRIDKWAPRVTTKGTARTGPLCSCCWGLTGSCVAECAAGVGGPVRLVLLDGARQPWRQQQQQQQ
jgi:hypothetical protein